MIKVFYDDDVSGSDVKEVSSIDFDRGNPDGIALGDILDKNVCSDEKLKKYVDEMFAKEKREQKMASEQVEARERREKLKNELLENNGEMIKSMLKECLISDEYTEETIDDILEDIEIGPKGMMVTGGGRTNPTTMPRSPSLSLENTITNFSERCIIIKIKPQSVMTKNGSDDEKLYEAVRRCWKNKLSKVRQAECVLAVVEGEVWGVYKPTRWYAVEQPECMNCPAGKNTRPCGRIAFEGEKASEDVQEKYLHKWIPDEYRRQGMAAPVLFPNVIL